MRYLSSGLVLLLLTKFANAASKTDLLRVLGPQGVNLWNLDKAQPSPHTTFKFMKDTSFPGQDEQQTPMTIPKFRARWFQQPLDHFDKNNTHKFHQRYWVNDRHYKPGTNAPVIVLDGGETSGEVRCGYWGTSACRTEMYWVYRTVCLSWTPELRKSSRKLQVVLVSCWSTDITVCIQKYPVPRSLLISA